MQSVNMFEAMKPVMTLLTGRLKFIQKDGNLFITRAYPRNQISKNL
jgi:hypothetical protein